MKSLFSVVLFFVSVPMFAQLTVNEQFQKINTMEQAQKYIEANPGLKPVIMNISWGKDTTVIAKRLLGQKKGDVFHVGYTTYKVLDSKEEVQYRASYVFLDGGSLSKREIDSLKNIIVQKANSGTSFQALSDQYTMDGNETHGDTGWFFGEMMMPKEFQDAVAKAKTGDIFFVEAPERQWYYIVKKTYDDQVKKDMVVLKSNGR